MKLTWQCNHGLVDLGITTCNSEWAWIVQRSRPGDQRLGERRSIKEGKGGRRMELDEHDERRRLIHHRVDEPAVGLAIEEDAIYAAVGQ